MFSSSVSTLLLPLSTEVTPTWGFKGSFRYVSHTPFMAWIVQAAVLFALPAPWLQDASIIELPSGGDVGGRCWSPKFGWLDLDDDGHRHPRCTVLRDTQSTHTANPGHPHALHRGVCRGPTFCHLSPWDLSPLGQACWSLASCVNDGAGQRPQKRDRDIWIRSYIYI